MDIRRIRLKLGVIGVTDQNKEEMPGMPPCFTVAQAVDVINQVLDTAVPTIDIVGEVANFKINQGKWVFFDIKDDTAVLNCFMSVYALRMELADGMQVKVRVTPNLTKWGRFSLTVRAIRPIGEGAIKRAFELLKQKLTKEGLFDEARKRPLPVLPQHIGVISSNQAAGYKDFIKIVNARMGGMRIDVISTQVQGDAAADQIITAIQQFNELPDPPEVLCILRGGGSREDLAVFDDEKLVRAVAASRIPTLTGVGHEVDTTLIDLVADKRASTPSNAAELLVPDRRELIATTAHYLKSMVDILVLDAQQRRDKLTRFITGLNNSMALIISNTQSELATLTIQLNNQIARSLSDSRSRSGTLIAALRAYDPQAVLKRGYAIIWDEHHGVAHEWKIGMSVTAETDKKLIAMEVKNVRDK